MQWWTLQARAMDGGSGGRWWGGRSGILGLKDNLSYKVIFDLKIYLLCTC